MRKPTRNQTRHWFYTPYSFTHRIVLQLFHQYVVTLTYFLRKRIYEQLDLNSERYG